MQYLQAAVHCVRVYTPVFYYLTIFFGFTTLFSYLWRVLRGVIRLFFQRRRKFADVYGKDSWVLITGSSYGIGKQLAFQFAQEGLNILLLARTQSKLIEVKEAILSQFPTIKVQIIVQDLVKSGGKDNIEDVLTDLSQYDISVVVNNAGVDVLDQYTNLSIETIASLIQINCFALTALTYLFLKRHLQRLKRTGKRCSIMNVSSVAGEMPIPLHNVYSASKGYVNQLTRNLTLEYPEIDWLVLRPSEVCTPMTCNKPLDIFTITAKKCASSTLDDLGHVAQTNGAISHKIQSFIYSLVPSWLFNLLWTKLFAPEFMQQRKQYYQKMVK